MVCSSAMTSDLRNYSGGCHCGKVRYDVSMALGKVITCNCSICSKRGLLLSFVPAGQFTLKSGNEALHDYQWGKKRINHQFCTECGIQSFARGVRPDGAAMVAINV